MSLRSSASCRKAVLAALAADRPAAVLAGLLGIHRNIAGGIAHGWNNPLPPVVKHLRRGCLQIQRDEDGNPYRWKVRSLAFKGERDTAGVPATWVVGEPVARAIKVMESLQLPDVDHLFSRLGHGPAAQEGTFAALTSGATNTQLARFVTWINDYCADTGRPDVIPKVNKMVFPLKTSVFRRTHAWFIARRPGGVIAGALQYRHASIQMFEGYAKARELHPMGEKWQVASSWPGSARLGRY
ncbi:hypothetical protein [Streptomyces sp. NL15-2K]|uniref:hypothetical protein n=1 Tax=Streptomyces sp. NL15-2K TaxID=376149 RepID=UPI000F5726F3|nr:MULTISPECIES: hypothetical protein [Actinomycetes]WKX07429.1 hypothetical protein Q4V64_07975 [Kutzneria buriramensis]